MANRKKQPQQDNRPITSIMNIKSNDDLRSFLEDRPQLNLTLMRQKNDSTLIHFAAFKNELQKLKIYVLHFEAFAKQNLKHSRNDPSFQNQLKAWINVENKDGLTALHFASLHGNIQMIEFLERYGANMQALTRQQDDILMMAVENNHFKLIVYLLENRQGKIPFDPNRTNQRGETPLHKASLSGFTIIASYLLSLPEADLNRNARNNEGWTPLMCAVSGGHKEVVKRMLLKGVDRHIKNSEGQRAIELAKSQGRNDMVRMLNDQFTCWQRIKIACNVKVVYRVEQPSRSYSCAFLVLFNLLFLPSQVLSQVTIFNSPYYFYGIAGAFYLIVLGLFWSLTSKHPRKAGGDLLEAQLPVCAECRQSTRPSDFHCFICGVCVWRYDHHCPWINNCVSALNIGKFTLFLFLVIFAAAEVLFMSLSLQLNAFEEIKPTRLIPILDDVRQILVLVNLIVCGGLSLVMSLMLCSLLGDQLKNLVSNSSSYERNKNIRHKKDSLLTTNERSLANSEEIKDVEEDDEDDDEPNCFANCCTMLSEKYTS